MPMMTWQILKSLDFTKKWKSRHLKNEALSFLQIKKLHIKGYFMAKNSFAVEVTFQEDVESSGISHGFVFEPTCFPVCSNIRCNLLIVFTTIKCMLMILLLTLNLVRYLLVSNSMRWFLNYNFIKETKWNEWRDVFITWKWWKDFISIL